jgi:uncharacterized protein (TIGR02300 family)
MGRPELGTKCTCTGCNERFYDLNRALAICPKCGVQQTPQKPRSAWPARGSVAARRPNRAPEQAVADEEPVPMTTPDDEDDDSEAGADSEDDDAENVIDPDHDALSD